MTPQPTPMHFPIDECAKCTVRGDMGGCLATRCSLHESWYARTQHTRITELESQLAQRFDAADVATAAAQGFRDGVASVANQPSKDTNTASGAADLQLADAYAKAHAMYCMEELYGSSKSYTAELLKARIDARNRLAAALASTPAQAVAPARDLAAVIKGAADKLDAAVRCHPNAVDTLIHEALEILDGDREPDGDSAHSTAQADTQPAPVLDEAFDCARAALNHCLDRASIAHILDTLRTRMDKAVLAAARAPAGSVQEDAARDVLAERQRQISAEGWTPEHDDEHDSGELAGAAGCYARHVNARSWVVGTAHDDYAKEPAPDAWPWDESWWKPTNPRRDLIKAGALILAELDRIDRADRKQGATK